MGSSEATLDIQGAGATCVQHVLPNRDYYEAVSVNAQTSPTSPFNGATGMGYGSLANRPITCTTTSETADAGNGGVGYFATDAGPQGTLYTCSATNTWTVHYQPYAYPHPLTLADSPRTCFQLGGTCCGGSQTCSGTTQPASDCSTCCTGGCQDVSLCGNSVCSTGETCTSCPEDCTKLHHADNNPCNGCIDGSEIIVYIDLWKANSQDVSIAQLIEAIGLWKSGCLL
jgi:hypothetical protein